MSVQPAAEPIHGRRLKGPTAVGGDVGRLGRLALTLAITDFKTRFFGSALGYLWQLMRPLMLFGVLYLVFSQIFTLKGGERFYPVGLLTGIVLFQFFGEATSGAVRSVVLRENLVRKIDFPRLAVPLSTLIAALFNLALNLVPVFVFLLATGGTPRASWVQIPLLLGMLCTLALGLGLLLSVVYVWARDIDPIWDVVLQVLFYASPILYTLSFVRNETAAEWIPKAMVLNPFTTVLQQFRHALLGPSWESPIQTLGGRVYLLIPIGIVLVLLATGAWVFSRQAPKMAEEL